MRAQSTRAQFINGFSKYVETGWFTEHLLNGIGFQIAAAFPAMRYYIMPGNENQIVSRKIFRFFRTHSRPGACFRKPRNTRSRSTAYSPRAAKSVSSSITDTTYMSYSPYHPIPGYHPSLGGLFSGLFFRSGLIFAGKSVKYIAEAFRAASVPEACHAEGGRSNGIRRTNPHS